MPTPGAAYLLKGGIIMTEIICSAIAAAAAIVCAVVTTKMANAEKERKKAEDEQSKAYKERAKESRLQLAMIAANSKLTVGVAMALKHGHANGEVEAGLEAVDKANGEYTTFLEELALNQINKA